MANIGLETDVREAAEAYLHRLGGRRGCQYVMPVGASKTKDEGVVWYFDDSGTTALVLSFVEEVVCITFLACMDDPDPDRAVQVLVATMLEDASQLERPVLAKVPVDHRQLFGRLGFVTLCTYLTDAPYSLLAHSANSHRSLLALRNFDGNNPDLLSSAFPCGAPDCDRYGRHVCKQCRRTVYCSRACQARSRLYHMRCGCKPADHVVRRLLGRFDAVALPTVAATKG